MRNGGGVWVSARMPFQKATRVWVSRSFCDMIRSLSDCLLYSSVEHRPPERGAFASMSVSCLPHSFTCPPLPT